NAAFERARKYFLEDVRGNPALWAKHLRDQAALKGPARLLGYAPLALNQAALRLPVAQRAFLSSHRVLLRDGRIQALLKSLEPKVVVATYPVNNLEAAFLFAAQHLGIP